MNKHIILNVTNNKNNNNMFETRNRRRKNNIILCELYNEKIHGSCEDVGVILNTHYFVITLFKNLFENKNEDSDSDENDSILSNDTIDNSDIENSSYSLKVKETIQLHQNKYLLLRRNLHLMAHPTIRNYKKIVTHKNYIKPEIATCYLMNGVLVATLKTFWLKIIQRKWKKIYNQRQTILQNRKSISNILYRELHGKWHISCFYLPSITGMMNELNDTY